jgi:uncharacterized protein YbaR (Trm112 family)
MISPLLLEFVRCPVSGQPLRQATPEELKQADCDEALVREDGRMLYPIQNGIPLLVASAAVDIRDSRL